MVQSRVKPIVTLVGAMAVDGKIATRTGKSQISSLSDLKQLHQIRSENDAVMIGIGTLLHDNPRLTVRHVKGKSPIRIIVDGSARTPPDSRIFTKGGPPVIVAVTKRAPKIRVDGLRQAGARVIQIGKNQVNLKILLAHLYRLGIKRILLEGGGKLNWSMISNGLVDKIMITVAPIIIGGCNATTLVDGKGVPGINQAVKLTLDEMRRRDDEIILHYTVRKG